MEILNRTKQQYISQNYVILRARIHTVQYALARAVNWPWLFVRYLSFFSFRFFPVCLSAIDFFYRSVQLVFL